MCIIEVLILGMGVCISGRPEKEGWEEQEEQKAVYEKQLRVLAQQLQEKEAEKLVIRQQLQREREQRQAMEERQKLQEEKVQELDARQVCSQLGPRTLSGRTLTLGCVTVHWLCHLMLVCVTVHKMCHLMLVCVTVHWLCHLMLVCVTVHKRCHLMLVCVAVHKMCHLMLVCVAVLRLSPNAGFCHHTLVCIILHWFVSPYTVVRCRVSQQKQLRVLKSCHKYDTTQQGPESPTGTDVFCCCCRYWLYTHSIKSGEPLDIVFLFMYMCNTVGTFSLFLSPETPDLTLYLLQNCPVQ